MPSVPKAGGSCTAHPSARRVTLEDNPCSNICPRAVAKTEVLYGACFRVAVLYRSPSQENLHLKQAKMVTAGYQGG